MVEAEVPGAGGVVLGHRRLVPGLTPRRCPVPVGAHCGPLPPQRLTDASLASTIPLPHNAPFPQPSVGFPSATSGVLLCSEAAHIAIHHQYQNGILHSTIWAGQVFASYIHALPPRRFAWRSDITNSRITVCFLSSLFLLFFVFFFYSGTPSVPKDRHRGRAFNKRNRQSPHRWSHHTSCCSPAGNASCYCSHRNSC